MKSLNDVFEKFEKNVIKTNLIYAGAIGNTGGKTNATGCGGEFDIDTAGDPKTTEICETSCSPDPDQCDTPIARLLRS